jgi:Uma2 family endonuclease
VSDMAAPSALGVRTRPITVGEYYRMAEVGIFRPNERVELLSGRILEMPPIGTRHGYTVAALDATLQALVDDRAVIFCQSALRLDVFSEPQPDILIVRGPIERYLDAHPIPVDALLVIEVAESTLPHDRGEKLRAYARAGIAEYWIVDLVHGHIEVYTEPDGDRYDARRSVQRGDVVSPHALPDVVLHVDKILPGSA